MLYCSREKEIDVCNVTDKPALTQVYRIIILRFAP